MQDRDRVNRIYKLLIIVQKNDLQFQRGWLSGFFDGEELVPRKALWQFFISQRKTDSFWTS
jgi:hypothetical protein